MHWTYEGNWLTFALDVDGKWSWLALGVSEAGGMLGMDSAVVRLSGTTWTIMVIFT
jgi:hypothetical protein